jgi:hypothetical protein
MTLEGIVANGSIVLAGGATLPEGTRVRVVAEPDAPPPRTAKELLLQFAGCMTDLPPDLARNHNHYLHGTPRE